jgi:hypothetical protein
MSEQDTTTTPDDAATAPEDTTQEATGAPETGQGDQGDPKTRKGDKDAVLADLAKERRQRQAVERERQALEKRLKDFEDRDLTEIQKAQKQAAEATKELEQLRAESLRQRVALKHEIPSDLIGNILGSTEDEMESSAAVLARYAKPKAPRPDHTQGSRADRQGPPNMNDLLRQAAGIR